MEGIELNTIQDCEDLLEGSTWLATGGGGSLDEGMIEIKKALEDGLSLGWVPVESIPDDVWTVTVGVHGSIAPISQETLGEINRLGLIEEAGDGWVAESVKELEEYLGHKFGCLVPSELGPGAIADAITAGARLGIPVVDGDYVGRAVPEELQATYCLYGKQRYLFASADQWGNITIVKEAANSQMLERIAKMLSLAAYGATAVASTPLPAREMKQILVRGTLAKCLDIGQALRHARETGEDPIHAALEIVGGWRLFDGAITRLETEDRDGYFFGTVDISGEGKDVGHSLKIWFKNENQISWIDGEPWVCSPDLVSLVRRKTGRGIYNAELETGDKVVAIGMRGIDAFRTEAGLALAGPRHFGFDIDYKPIEDLLAADVRNQA